MTPLRLIILGALTAAALAVPASSQPPMPVVNIMLGSHYYAPNPIYLAGGVPTRIVFINRAGKGHDFHAERFFRSARILSGRVYNGEVDLGARQRTVVTLIPARGSYPVHCTKPFHKLLGMKGRLIVS
jgi:plastocyanin